MIRIVKSFHLIFLFQLILLFSPLQVKATEIFQKYSNTPILPVGNSGTWDSYSVGAPSVYFNGSKFHMWYEGNNGAIWRIGYASSDDGKQWSKNSSFVINSIDQQDNISVHNPQVIQINGEYKMWFSSSAQNITNMYINYIASIDPDQWSSPPTQSVLTSTESWENAGRVADPTILYKDLYRMWYAGNDNTDHWRIGYASSEFPDHGWSKNSTFVLEGKNEFVGEGNSISGPDVLYENGIYHMFYTGAGSVGHAVSKDGIKWFKNPNNPVLRPSTNSEYFDSGGVGGTFTLKYHDPTDDKDKYYMYYTGTKGDTWQIGLAISDTLPDVPIPEDTLTGTPTTTPASTPTPTITPTPTVSLTPTPTLFSPIVIIPGLGASWNPQDIFSCNIESSHEWKLAPYVSAYNRLIDTLTQGAHLEMNQDVYLYTYDWRQEPHKLGEKFALFVDKILSQKPEGTKIQVIGHSLGGLVIRSYLSHFTPNKIAKVMTVGTPHKGTALAYPPWAGGDIKNSNKYIQSAVSQIVNYCSIKNLDFKQIQQNANIFNSAKRKTIQKLVPSIQSLLPLFPYLQLNNQLMLPTHIINQNTYLLSSEHAIPTSIRTPDTFWTLSGKNNLTMQGLNVEPPQQKDIVSGNWLDGKPIGEIKTSEGDGTILLSSSVVNGVTNKIIMGNHTQIVSGNEGISSILAFLNLSYIPIVEAISLPEESAESITTISMDKPSTLNLFDLKGKLLGGEEDILTLYDLKDGIFVLTINPHASEVGILQVSVLNREELPPLLFLKTKFKKNKQQKYILQHNTSSRIGIKLIPLN